MDIHNTIYISESGNVYIAHLTIHIAHLMPFRVVNLRLHLRLRLRLYTSTVMPFGLSTPSWQITGTTTAPMPSYCETPTSAGVDNPTFTSNASLNPAKRSPSTTVLGTLTSSTASRVRRRPTRDAFVASAGTRSATRDDLYTMYNHLIFLLNS